MRLTINGLHDRGEWLAAEITPPNYDIAKMAERTKENPAWLHFGAGNIFRGYIAELMQHLLDNGEASTGIIAAETYDFDIIDQIFLPHDNMSLNVTLNANGSMDCGVCASIAEAIRADNGFERLKAIFVNPSLQMVSFTITEKGYTPGPDNAMTALTDLLYIRFQAGAFPIALVSMDNCSKNGERLQSCVLTLAKAMNDDAFTAWLSDETKVSYPWSMIDKITPRPDAAVEKMLVDKGVLDIQPVITDKKTYIAPFVNAEKAQYLVIEDNFPNSRPALEKSGVIFTDRATVEKTERMKVTVCLNPLHTSMAVFGCLLGYEKISDETKDADIAALIHRLGYIEGLPVVPDPGILSPKAFIDEVINERLPNPFLPDTPQRIATDTSQKVSIRFGETIKSYVSSGKDLTSLVAIPLTIAAWLRYLNGTDDNGQPMPISADPLLDALKEKDAALILSDANIFGLDLMQTTLGDRILGYYEAMKKAPGAVRATLQREIRQS
jgi:fructuronate reductase